MPNISLGEGIVVSGKPIKDRTTGKRDTTDLFGEVRSVTIDLGAEPKTSIRFTSDPEKTEGIAPTMFCTVSARSDSTLTCAVVDRAGAALVDSANNEFADINQPTARTDLSYFDCYETSADGTVTARTSCGCGDYAVTIFERHNETLIYDPTYATGEYQNVWQGTLTGSAINLGTGAFEIELDGTNNFDTVDTANGDFVVIFADAAHANIQTCQLDYGWLGDENGEVANNAGTKRSAILIKGT
jgi:hypothetical protein